jgi:predicted nucleic acid-binding protein
VNAAVLDASVVVKWFRSEDEQYVEQARRLRNAYATGELVAFAPPILRLEILNVAGRRWRLREAVLAGIAATLDELRFELLDPEPSRVAPWVSRGLSAYDASYVALAEREAVPLVTEDGAIVCTAPGIAIPLADLPA